MSMNPMQGVRNVLFCLTNAQELNGIKTGFDLPECAISYWVLKDSLELKINIDFVTPAGGPVEYDEGSVLKAFADDARIRAFLDNPGVRSRLQSTLGASQIMKPEDYDAILFIGGLGCYRDFDDTTLNNIASSIYKNKGVVASLGEGVIALLNAKLHDIHGHSEGWAPLIKGQKVCGPSDDEYSFGDRTIDTKNLPFSIEKAIVDKGGVFWSGVPGAEKIHAPGRLYTHDKLVTGQNAHSAERVAHEMVRLMLQQSRP